MLYISYNARGAQLGGINAGSLAGIVTAQVPPNGLVVYTGTIMTDDGKEKKVNIDFEPFKPINTSLYLCDNKFHTEALNELLESDNKCVCRRPGPRGGAAAQPQQQRGGEAG